MKRLLLLFTLILSACTTSPSSQTIDKINLESKYYGVTTISEITTVSDYQILIDDQENALVYIYNPQCYACSLFYPYLENFVENEKIAVLKMPTSVMLSTPLVEDVFYTPSLVILKEGELFKLLDPTVEEHAPSFRSTEALTTWIFTYINEAYIDLPTAFIRF